MKTQFCHFILIVAKQETQPSYANLQCMNTVPDTHTLEEERLILDHSFRSYSWVSQMQNSMVKGLKRWKVIHIIAARRQRGKEEKEGRYTLQITLPVVNLQSAPPPYRSQP